MVLNRITGQRTNMSPFHSQIKEVAGYRLAEHIGSGGMGDVYKAFNHSLNRVAAVKILTQEAHADRFKNEATIQSTISHPNIARLYEYAETEGKLCIVMEYVEGESLDHYRNRKGRLTGEETEGIIRQIASALAYLHQKDIIHRDIKPQNFKVLPDGTVKMLDFGIAKNKLSPKLTQHGFVVGTMEYLAPEQFEQKEERRSDMWSLGVMTYELLTGYMPFESNNPLTLRMMITKGNFTNPKILVPGISERLALLIEKCLKVNPAVRITAAEAEKILGKRSLSSGIHKTPETGMQSFLSKKVLFPLAGIAVIVLLVLFIRNNKPASPDIPVVEKVPEKNTVVANQRSVQISVPGINDAELINTNNERLSLPYTVKGQEGEKFEFTIRADGYQDKKVEVVITSRRSSFEYNLEKINN